MMARKKGLTLEEHDIQYDLEQKLEAKQKDDALRVLMTQKVLNRMCMSAR